MKRLLTIILIVTLLFNLCPIGSVSAMEEEFVNIYVLHDGKNMNCRVIKIGTQLMFSGEDLATFGNYTYRIEGDNAYFIRGSKTVRVNIAHNYLIPYDGTVYSKHNEKIMLNTSIHKVDGIYYFPGTQLLPWLSVTCSVTDGKLNIVSDRISIWDLTAEFDPKDYEFDFAKCCKELGKDSKWVKSWSGIRGFRLVNLIESLPLIKKNSEEEHDYYDLFEDMLQDKTCSELSANEFMEDVDNFNQWMNWAETMQVEDDLPDELKVMKEIFKVFDSVPAKLTKEVFFYLSTIELDNQEKLNALKYIVISGYNFPESMRAAAYTIYLEYTDRILGILGKGIDVLFEKLEDLVIDTPYKIFNIILAWLDLPGMVAPEISERIQRISSYVALAECSATVYMNEKDTISTIGIQNTRSAAYLYLYSTEQNWRTMSEYAMKQGQYKIAETYALYGDKTKEMAIKFLTTARPDTQLNDSPKYGDGEQVRKQTYTDNLKEMFSKVEKLPDMISQEQNSTEKVIEINENSKENAKLSTLLTNNFWEVLCITDMDGNVQNLDIVLGEGWNDIGGMNSLYFYSKESLFPDCYGLYLLNYTDGESDGMRWGKYECDGNEIRLKKDNFGEPTNERDTLILQYVKVNYCNEIVETLTWSDQITDIAGNTASYKLYFAKQRDAAMIRDICSEDNQELIPILTKNIWKVYCGFDYTGEPISPEDIWGQGLKDNNSLCFRSDGTFIWNLYGHLSECDNSEISGVYKCNGNKVTLYPNDSSDVFQMEYTKLDYQDFTDMSLLWYSYSKGYWFYLVTCK